MASWTERKQELLDEAQKIDSSIRLYTKDNFFCRAMAWILHILSFGKMSASTYQTNYATTLGNFMFYPANWDYETVNWVLPHEAQHVKQFRWFSCFIHPLLGLPVAALVYLMFPLPAWFSWGRFWMEYNADTVLFKHLASIGEKNMLVDYAPQRIAALSGPEYLWAVSFNYAKKRYDKLLASL